MTFGEEKEDLHIKTNTITDILLYTITQKSVSK